MQVVRMAKCAAPLSWGRLRGSTDVRSRRGGSGGWFLLVEEGLSKKMGQSRWSSTGQFEDVSESKSSRGSSRGPVEDRVRCQGGM